MQTLSLFPAFFDYQLLGIFLLRVALGFVFFRLWYTQITKHRADGFTFFQKLHLRPSKLFFWLFSTIGGLASVLLIIGLYTQGAAIATWLFMFIATFIKWLRPEILQRNTLSFYFILSIASLSLLFLGAGAFAVDLPL